LEIYQLGGSVHQVPFIKYVKSYHQVITIDNRPFNPGHNLSDKYINISILDQSLKDYFSKNNYKISSFGSDLAERIRLEIINKKKSTRYKLTSKIDSRKIIMELSEKIDLPYLKNCSINDLEKKPIVIKPNISSGSKGVSIITKYNKKLLSEKIELAKRYSIDGRFQVEECFEGDLTKYYAESYSFADADPIFIWGKSLQRKGTLINDGSIQMGDSFDNSEISRHLKNYIKELTNKIGIKFVPLNIDFFIKKNKIVVIESTPRPGGNCLSLILNIKSNNNYFFNLMKYYLDETDDLKLPNFEKLFDNRFYFVTMKDKYKKNCLNVPQKSSLIKEFTNQNNIALDYSGYKLFAMN